MIRGDKVIRCGMERCDLREHGACVLLECYKKDKVFYQVKKGEKTMNKHYEEV